MLEERRFGERTSALLAAVVVGPTRGPRAPRAGGPDGARRAAAERSDAGPALRRGPADGERAVDGGGHRPRRGGGRARAAVGRRPADPRRGGGAPRLLLAVALARATLAPLAGLLTAATAAERGQRPPRCRSTATTSSAASSPASIEMAAAMDRPATSSRSAFASAPPSSVRRQRGAARPAGRARGPGGRAPRPDADAGRARASSSSSSAGRRSSAPTSSSRPSWPTCRTSCARRSTRSSASPSSLRDDLGGTLEPRHKKYLEDVRSSGRHLLGLINDILDLSKIEAGHVELELEPVSAAAPSRRRWGSCGSGRSSKGLTLDVERRERARCRRTPSSCGRSC